MTDSIKRSIEQAAETLKSFGAKEVYVFGSAATDSMREDSDVDMAVSGLPPGVFYRAWAKAVHEFPGREMDLVDLDTPNDLFVKNLKEWGELRRVG